MPGLNDFYAFKMTSSGGGSGGSGNNNSSIGNGSGTGCSTALIVLAVIGWCCGLKVDRDIKTANCFHFVLDNGNWDFIEEFDTGIKA